MDPHAVRAVYTDSGNKGSYSQDILDLTLCTSSPGCSSVSFIINYNSKYNILLSSIEYWKRNLNTFILEKLISEKWTSKKYMILFITMYSQSFFYHFLASVFTFLLFFYIQIFYI